MRINRLIFTLCALAAVMLAGVQGSRAAGFVKLFDGKTLTGWTLVGGVGPGYVPKDGILDCPADGGGNLFTEKEYKDFVFRFEFKLDSGSNNGIGIRAPLQGDAAYMGMECQILDDSAPMYAHLEPGQYHSSIYKVVAAKRGSLKPVGQWNREEITAIGRHIKIVVNGMTTIDTNLNDVNDPKVFADHPGFRRDKGHIGFLGHGPADVQFRNIYLKDLTRPERDNTAPDGFTLLFDGKDLKGWKGLVADPPHRAAMSASELAAAQKTADEAAFQHWKVENGEIVYDGKNNNLCTAKDYGDFEMLVDWKIEKGGDSGIYLRGSPQVQIWDPDNHPGRPGEGSGGLYNNEKNPSGPSRRADNPVGEWNRFRILMIGDKVTVYLNDVLVVQNVTMENYWERNKPIYPVGQIELQHHGSILRFKNIYIREIAVK
ncbi:MAG TPA: DUF1080 domain-containing protein [Chthonomonadaceae bacterium]|nr:DUF1080 domain-containing protein [Chthonomonadaceae bacterium]